MKCQIGPRASLHVSPSLSFSKTHTRRNKKNTYKPNVWWKCLCNLNSGCALKKPIHLFHINPISSLTDRAQWCGLPGYCCYYCCESMLRLNNSLTHTRKVMRGVFICSGIKSSRVSIILTKQMSKIDLFNFILHCCCSSVKCCSLSFLIFEREIFFSVTEGCNMFKTIRHRCYSNSMSLIIFSLINICWSQTKTEHTDIESSHKNTPSDTDTPIQIWLHLEDRLENESAVIWVVPSAQTAAQMHTNTHSTVSLSTSDSPNSAQC